MGIGTTTPLGKLHIVGGDVIIGNPSIHDASSEEDRARMMMLRELSRLQDDQRGLEQRTRGIHERWREAIAGQEADEPGLFDRVKNIFGS